MITIPVLVQTTTSNSLLLRQWVALYRRGQIRGPAIATLAGLTYAYAAYAKSHEGGNPTGYGIAGLMTVAMVPYTWAVMGSVNRSLIGAVLAESAMKSEEAKVLVARWARLNTIRALFPLLGALVGLWCVLMQW